MGVAITNISASDDLETTSRGYINTNFSNIATDLDGFPDDLKNLSAAEIGELENIGATTISAAQWGYLGASNQGIATTDSPTFANITDSGLTASELMATNASKKLVSLAVATYPSLTELAYVKGLTSAIQTQLDARCLESVFGTAIGTGLTLDATTLKTHAALQSIAGLTYVSGSFIALTSANTYTVRTYAETLSDIGAAATDQTMYIGTTAVAINRGTAALTLAGITLTTPDIGTPSAGTLTNCSFPTLNQNTTGSAATLTTARTIAGQSFDGSANITIASTDLSDTTTVGGNLVSLTNPSAETFIKIAADNTVSTRTPANVMADLSGHAAAAFAWNSQNLTGVGTLGCGAITTSNTLEINPTLVGGIKIKPTTAPSTSTAYQRIAWHHSNDALLGYIQMGYDTDATNDNEYTDISLAATQAGSKLKFYSGNTLALTLDSSQNATFAGNIIMGDEQPINTGTSDTTDNKMLILAGGGAALATRGAVIKLSGNEDGFPGRLYMAAGSTGTIITASNVNPDGDGIRDLGTQTTAQWANVWADLVNGSDYSMLNGWRILESEKYKGYPKGIAIGKDGFKDGVVTEKMPDNIKPIFVITEDFIEYKGIRITEEMLKKINQ